MSRIGADYICLQDKASSRGGWRWIGLGLAAPLIVGAMSLTGPDADDGEEQALLTRTILLPDSPGDTPVALAAAAPPQTVSPLSDRLADAAAAPDADSQPDWTEVEIRHGDTLSLAFERHQLSYRDSLAIAHMGEYGKRFTRSLKAGDVLRVRADDEGNVLALDYPLDAIRTLEIRAAGDGDGDGYRGEIVTADVDHRPAYAVGTIDTSFYIDAQEAGLSDKLIMNLAYIFGWDIDFVYDIRAGDHFIVIYDELYRDGDKIGDGKILAAEFVNRGRTLRALRYTDDNGNGAYYAPDGEAMKKAFLRTPLNQFRISSRFNLQRKHPILNRIRAHKGTDYAAPTGTPVKATGNGRIVFRGRNGGYGNMIEIRHNGRYTTRYGHMSRFASGLGVGSRVRQGQVIGFVGMTGLATGPHLHYEFRVNGAPRNPETVALPKADPLPRKYRADFQGQITPLLAQLDALHRTQIASR